MMIRMHHVRMAGYCNRGAREFFRRHDLSWQQFVDEGIPEEQLIATGDHIALRVVEVAHADGK